MIRCFSICLLLTTVSAQEPQPATIPAGYRVETVPTPEGVPFGVGGLSFAADGTLYACTREGHVWTWRDGKWRQFATGLHEPLGIFVDPQDGRVFVVQRPELTELVDTDGDGRADHFKTVSAGWGLTDNYHEYAFGLVRDAQGYYYGTLNTSLSWAGWAGSDKWDVARVHDSKMGRAARYRGWSFRISPQGAFEPWSSGLRSPAGIGMTRDGAIFYTENQGDWVASSGLHHVVKGRFHGHPSSLLDHPEFAGTDLDSVSIQRYDELRTPPAVYFPHGDLANSPGEPVWDYTGGKFGPFQDQCFVGDQGRSNVFRVVLDKVDGEYQGCAINFADHLQSGVVRCRFAPDGSLFVGQTGRGWGSRGKARYGVQRLVWDGSTVPFAIHSVRLTKAGFQVRFTSPAAADALASSASYQVVRWRYRYQPSYGSKKYDRGPVTVTAVRPDADGRGVALDLPTAAGWVYQLTFDLAGADGSVPANRIAWYTLNRLPR
jgi:glucose/arabinose dehydrogenase